MISNWILKLIRVHKYFLIIKNHLREMQIAKLHILVSLVLLVLLLVSTVQGNWSQFYRQRGRLIFQEEFNTLNKSRWQHVITAWRGGNNEFEYYTDRPENR